MKKTTKKEEEKLQEQRDAASRDYLSDAAQDFLRRQKEAFERDSHLMPLRNHKEHDADVDYWTILLEHPLRQPNRFLGSKALDFGCGCGRNLRNLLALAPFERVDGVDISPSNVEYTYKYMNNIAPGQVGAWETVGHNLGPGVEDNTYSFIMSHVVFQHIGNYIVRYSILRDMFRALEPEGIVSLHFMDLQHSSVGYYTSARHGNINCRVEDPMFIYRDLDDIGFEGVSIRERLDKYSGARSFFVRATKPGLLGTHTSVTIADEQGDK